MRLHSFASNTAPVVEMMVDGESGLLVDFFDVDGLVQRAVEVLRDPTAFRTLGERAATDARGRGDGA